MGNRLLHVSTTPVKCFHLLRRWESKQVLLREPRLQYHSTKETRLWIYYLFLIGAPNVSIRGKILFRSIPDQKPNVDLFHAEFRSIFSKFAKQLGGFRPQNPLIRVLPRVLSVYHKLRSIRPKIYNSLKKFRSPPAEKS